MLSNLKNIWKVPDLRNKVAFTITIIAVYELGANIIAPYISATSVGQLETEAKQAGGTTEILAPPYGDRRPPAKGNALTNR